MGKNLLVKLWAVNVILVQSHDQIQMSQDQNPNQMSQDDQDQD